MKSLLIILIVAILGYLGLVMLNPYASPDERSSIGAGVLTLVVLLLACVLLARIFHTQIVMHGVFRFFPGERDWIGDLYDYLGRSVASGRSVADALIARMEDPGPRWLRKTLRRVVTHLQNGMTFSQAVVPYPAVFPRSDRAIIEVGERSGQMAQTFAYLAAMAKSKSMRNFPGFLVLLEVLYIPLVVSFVLIVIIPKFKEIFDQLGGELPMPTQNLIMVSYILAHQTLWVLLLLLVLYFALRIGRLRAWFARKLPLLGSVYWPLALSRMSYVLGTMLQSGVDLASAVPLSIYAARNTSISQARNDVVASIENGQPLDVALTQVKGIPPDFLWYVRVGLEREKPEHTFLLLADRYREEHATILYHTGAILLPIVNIFLGAVVAYTLVSLYMPLFMIPSLVGVEG